MPTTLQQQPRQVIRWAAFGLAVSIALIVLKFAAYAITGSAAMLSDALESGINVFTSGFALFAVWLSAQPKDANHPYGHGKIEYVAAAIEGVLIAAAGIGVLLVSVRRFVEPQSLERLDVGLVLTFVVACIALAAGTLLIRAGRRHESPTLEADGVHIRADAFTSFGAFGSTLVVHWTGLVWVDAAAAMLLGAVLVFSGIRVLRRSVGGLMDEAVPGLLDQIGEVLHEVREPGIIAPHAVKVHRLGQAIHIDLHLVLPRFWSLEHAHDVSHRAEDALREAFGTSSEVMLVYEPCTERSCSYCDLADCPIRGVPMVRTLPWTGATIARRNRPAPIPQTGGD
jgi:cation diffusion facilitator family transporter